MDQESGLKIWLILLCSILLCLSAAGCRPESLATEIMATGDQPIPSNTPTTAATPTRKPDQPTQVLPNQSETPTTQPSTVPQGTPTQPEAADTPGSRSGVSVTVDRSTYSKGDTIVVTVSNRLDEAIVTLDQKAFCSIITLQIQEGDNWKEVINCFSGEPPGPVFLPAGSVQTIEFPADLAAGTYRAALIFSKGERFSFDQAQTVTSDPFVIE